MYNCIQLLRKSKDILCYPIYLPLFATIQKGRGRKPQEHIITWWRRWPEKRYDLSEHDGVLAYSSLKGQKITPLIERATRHEQERSKLGLFEARLPKGSPKGKSSDGRAEEELGALEVAAGREASREGRIPILLNCGHWCMFKPYGRLARGMGTHESSQKWFSPS